MSDGALPLNPDPRMTLVQMVSGCLHDGAPLTHEECNAEAERIVAEYEAVLRAEIERLRSDLALAEGTLEHFGRIYRAAEEARQEVNRRLDQMRSGRAVGPASPQ